MPRKKATERNIYKLLFQFSVLALLFYMGIRILFDKVYAPDFEAYCPFGGLLALSSYFQMDSLACTMTSTQIMMGIILAAGIMLFGKLFCGYICPVGIVSEYLQKLGYKINLRFEIKRVLDLVLRSLKYILLFITFYFTLESGELFCKKYDSYFAISSGFGADVVLSYSLVAISLLIFGSIFFRLFWCKYLCPVAAISNIFKFFWFFLGITGIYLIIILAGIDLSYVWPLLVIIFGGYILEIWKKENVPYTPVKITRNEDSCISCNICNKKCPQGIDVANLHQVKHIDCNLCGDCLVACPEKNTLQINKRNWKWLPALVLIGFITMGVTISHVWEIPTINDRWGNPEEISNAAIYGQSGLKNIKCYGSSMAFASMLKDVKGIYGVSTFVKTHSVKILYDPSILNDTIIREIIFTPMKVNIRPLTDKIDSVGSYTLGIENFFDPMDAFYLKELLEQKTSSSGFYTEYGCPVIAHIFFPYDSVPELNKLVNILQSQILEYELNSQTSYAKIDYKVLIKEEKPEIIPMDEYSRKLYIPVNMRFNKFNTYSPAVLKVYEIITGEKVESRDVYDYLVSHLSNDPGIVSFETVLDEIEGEKARISFVDTMTTSDAIFRALNADSLRFTYNTGEPGSRLNPFSFKTEGRVIFTEK